MASGKRSVVRLVIGLLVILIIGAGALCGTSYYQVVEKANAAYAQFAPASARISRLKRTGAYTLSILWKLRFAKPSSRAPTVAVWHLQPFGAVDFQGGKH